MITRTRAIELPDWAGTPVEVEWSGWPVVEDFEPRHDHCAVGLTDLSHRPKAVLQGPATHAFGFSQPGQAVWTGRALVGSLKPDHAVVFDLTSAVKPDWHDPAYTDMTDGWVLFAL